MSLDINDARDRANELLAEQKPRKRSSTSPTQRSLKHMRAAGYVCQVVEKWNPHARIRQDLFGFIDIVALSPDGSTVGVQACSLSDVSKRVTKIGDAESLPALRRCGWKLLVQGWGKGADGKYRLREVDCS